MDYKSDKSNYAFHTDSLANFYTVSCIWLLGCFRSSVFSNICFVSDKRYCFYHWHENIKKITVYLYLLTGLWYGVKLFCLKIWNSPNSKIDKNIQSDLPIKHELTIIWKWTSSDSKTLTTLCLFTYCFDGRRDYYALGQKSGFKSIFESDRIYMRSCSESHIHLFLYLSLPSFLTHMKTISCASGFKMEWTD